VPRAPAPTEIYTLSLHDALPIFPTWRSRFCEEMDRQRREPFVWGKHDCAIGLIAGAIKSLTGVDVAKSYVDKYTTEADALTFLRSEEHTSELQSRENLVCRLLLE